MDANLLDALAGMNFVELPIRGLHAWAGKSLPPVHGDPFDRILVAQAKIENLTLVTRDQFLDQYHISILAA